ncbi:Tetratricopeptide repeat protein 4 [Eumeta japonica]|uniref:Tetratricopeptide repeat protein 4 n=1 Tax=Eumeta variegata TaxID=151549 RepID=A0A4C1W0H7_EUMVA|nr:Tetratricopeptide repeat protein 4 [Eumeta japonica]
MELLNLVKKKKHIQERDERKKSNIDQKKEKNKQMILNAIIERKIRISKCENADDIDLSHLEPSLPGAADALVNLENGILKWPVLFLYPEYQMTDFVRHCPENVALSCQLEQLFPAPWDEENKYHCETINVYFEGYDKLPHIVDTKKELGFLVVQKYFELKAGTPAFFVLPRGTAIEKRFLESYI